MRKPSTASPRNSRRSLELSCSRPGASERSCTKLPCRSASTARSGLIAPSGKPKRFESSTTLCSSVSSLIPVARPRQPRCTGRSRVARSAAPGHRAAHPARAADRARRARAARSEEHTSELQSLRHLVCRLLLEKKKKQPYKQLPTHTKKTNTEQ